eukprot:CAMPEP_0185448686 /NCGR_PEP_ID=MMETSP1365-20130426/59323_1 /TAXON_ID=38817 /ORGANISM="Gephyrocapsa oceanica, Strain RCC1303" /LENGTH=96 /DNA_ID=CAMNT_0028054675 /DNA_START=143 /DNA_END=429 /DNA_ORIENTATION=-
MAERMLSGSTRSTRPASAYLCTSGIVVIVPLGMRACSRKRSSRAAAAFPALRRCRRMYSVLAQARPCRRRLAIVARINDFFFIVNARETDDDGATL